MALIQVPPAIVSDNYTLLNSGGTSLSSTSTIISGISGKNSLIIYITGASCTSSQRSIGVRLNNDSSAIYSVWGSVVTGASNNDSQRRGEESANFLSFAQMGDNAAATVSGMVTILGCNSTGTKTFWGGSTYSNNQGTSGSFGGFYTGSSVITSVAIVGDGGTFDAGTVYVYGA